MLSFYVYILQCADRSYYTGHTDDIEKRIAEHKMGEYPCYTVTRLPIKLVYLQEFSTREEALQTEIRIKKWSRKKKGALIAKDWNKLSQLSKRRKSF